MSLPIFPVIFDVFVMWADILFMTKEIKYYFTFFFPLMQYVSSSSSQFLSIKVIVFAVPLDRLLLVLQQRCQKMQKNIMGKRNGIICRRYFSHLI